MLSLDVFKGQLNNKVLAEFKRINCTCSFILGGTTGFIQVYDVAINKPLKDQIVTDRSIASCSLSSRIANKAPTLFLCLLARWPSG
jgi:hypothetical protein